MKQMALDIVPSPPPTLENFVVGRNAEVMQTLKGVLAGREQEHFIYLWGMAGCGKSHLLQGAAASCAGQGMSLEYFACDADTRFLADSVPDCILVDDVERLPPAAQIDLFGLYNCIRDEGRTLLVVSGAAAPAQLRLVMREDLVTRLGWGLVYQVHELTDEEKAQAMKYHSASRGFDVPQEVCDYLLRHGRRDLPALVATLDALDRYSLASRRRITLPLLREWLQAAS